MNNQDTYLRIFPDFWNSRFVKKLRKTAGGDTYALLYLRMLELAARNDGWIHLEGIGTESEEIALELDESQENVTTILYALESCNRIERGGNGIFFPQRYTTPPEWEYGNDSVM